MSLRSLPAPLPSISWLLGPSFWAVKTLKKGTPASRDLHRHILRRSALGPEGLLQAYRHVARDGREAAHLLSKIFHFFFQMFQIFHVAHFRSFSLIFLAISAFLLPWMRCSFAFLPLLSSIFLFLLFLSSSLLLFLPLFSSWLSSWDLSVSILN